MLKLFDVPGYCDVTVVTARLSLCLVVFVVTDILLYFLHEENCIWSQNRGLFSGSLA
jgi:hypothetical protein